MRDKTNEPVGSKFCGRCEQTLPLTDELWLRDRRSTPHKWYGVCRPCRSESNRAWTRGEPSRVRLPIPCAQCGKDFTPGSTASSKAKFCSALCRSRGRAPRDESEAVKAFAYRARPEIREKIRQRSADWRANNKEYLEANKLSYYVKWKYGITQEDYDALVVAQEGCCAICGGTDFRPWTRLVVDHCHATGKVRGLLCHACNACIGQAKDDTDVLRNAADYIERTS